MLCLSFEASFNDTIDAADRLSLKGGRERRLIWLAHDQACGPAPFLPVLTQPCRHLHLSLLALRDAGRIGPALPARADSPASSKSRPNIKRTRRAERRCVLGGLVDRGEQRQDGARPRLHLQHILARALAPLPGRCG